MSAISMSKRLRICLALAGHSDSPTGHNDTYFEVTVICLPSAYGMLLSAEVNWVLEGRNSGCSGKEMAG